MKTQSQLSPELNKRTEKFISYLSGTRTAEAALVPLFSNILDRKDKFSTFSIILEII